MMIDPAQIRAAMKIPPQLNEAYQRLVAAGMKVMFSDQTQGIMLQQLKSSPDMVKNLSEGIAGLMAILFKQSKGLPQQVIVPAAVELLAHAVDFVTKTKMANLTPQQIAQATQATVLAVLAKFGVQPQQAQQIVQQMAQQGKGGMPMQQAPKQPQGIIQGAL